MRKTELKELYKMMFPEYPDIVTVAQLQQMLGVSRHLAYDLINNGYISGVKIGTETPVNSNQSVQRVPFAEWKELYRQAIIGLSV